MSTTSKTPLLDTINTPEELRKLQPAQMKQVADELRAEVIDAVSVTGGHLGAGLGVVELTVALHHFDYGVIRSMPFLRNLYSGCTFLVHR